RPRCLSLRTLSRLALSCEHVSCEHSLALLTKHEYTLAPDFAALVYQARETAVAARRALATSASPAVYTDAPSSPISLTRNPPAAESGASAPGVVNRNESVVKNVRMPARLPIAESFGEMGRSAIRIPVATSDTPKRLETPCRSRTEYSQPANGLCAT